LFSSRSIDGSSAATFPTANAQTQKMAISAGQVCFCDERENFRAGSGRACPPETTLLTIRYMFSRVIFVTVAAAVFISQSPALAKSCVWKITAKDGHTLYLGGSFHALRPTDYPLPPEYNRAFEASSRLVFEEDPSTGAASGNALLKSGQYPKGDNIKNHVDPRTYDYLRRFFTLIKVPEEKFRLYKPWLIDLILSAPPPEYSKLGVENFLWARAKTNSKQVSGLESSREHNQVFAGLSDRESEALLLILFINAAREDARGVDIVSVWRRGEAEIINKLMRESFRDFPSMAVRLLDARNRNWIPKIDGYLRSNQTHFVVVGAAHMGGSSGVLSLLRDRGYHIEQL